MTAKEYLSQAFWLNQLIDSKLEQLVVLRSLATKVTSSLSEVKVQNSNDEKSRLENTIIKIIELEGEINDDVDRLVDLKIEIRESINMITDINLKLLLDMRYLNGKGWDEIAETMGYDPRTVFRIHGKALKELGKKLSVNVSSDL
ncbi:DUF1492 domain-containing protein [Alkalibacter rhizosphaerae]|uniref:DUF1492 domain-containing protein n=1 Tax=Alkalibacter rhizosphaerae TaxID=2815577 RepID=A0A974XGR0_9FIRM|nr:DUF1492 domain-containing protein [Alkalibacter rhizosphaerae]QSX09557.1 DUF1492 domain-containing protein [Alkalibacter rhizosphaerae]